MIENLYKQVCVSNKIQGESEGMNINLRFDYYDGISE